MCTQAFCENGLYMLYVNSLASNRKMTLKNKENNCVEVSDFGVMNKPKLYFLFIFTTAYLKNYISK